MRQRCDSVPSHKIYGCLAQQVERLVEAQEVTDATPVAATINFMNKKRITAAGYPVIGLTSISGGYEACVFCKNIFYY